jgi:hypothetical protein
MTAFSLVVTIVLLALIALLLVTLWAMLSVAGEADDRAERYWSDLARLRLVSSSRSGLSSCARSASEEGK